VWEEYGGKSSKSVVYVGTVKLVDIRRKMKICGIYSKRSGTVGELLGKGPNRGKVSVSGSTTPNKNDDNKKNSKESNNAHAE
jgi:hypothetical protein